jgi:aldose sugar dehydrogenase
MKTPVVWVTAALTVAIVLTVSFLIATGTRGDNTPPVSPTERVLRMAPAGK